MVLTCFDWIWTTYSHFFPGDLEWSPPWRCFVAVTPPFPSSLTRPWALRQVAAMKAKQSSELGPVDTLDAAIQALFSSGSAAVWMLSHVETLRSHHREWLEMAWNMFYRRWGIHHQYLQALAPIYSKWRLPEPNWAFLRSHGAAPRDQKHVWNSLLWGAVDEYNGYNLI